MMFGVEEYSFIEGFRDFVIIIIVGGVFGLDIPEECILQFVGVEEEGGFDF